MAKTIQVHLTGLFLFIFCFQAVAQQPNLPVDKIAKTTEFAIPASPAFNLLNDNVPSRIQRYSTLRDFKVDWSFYNGQVSQGISPGLALEAQPVWLLFFDQQAATRYRQAGSFARTLSTLSFSFGTNITNEKNWLAWGVKLNLYRQYDPLNDSKFLKALEESTNSEKEVFDLKINDLEREKILLKKSDPVYDQRYNELEDSIVQMQVAIKEVEANQSQKLAAVREDYIRKHWNSSYLDVAYGKLSTYEMLNKSFSKTIEDPATGQDTTITFSSNSLKLSSEGWSAWVSGGVKAGKNGLVSGMVRYGVKPSTILSAKSNVLSMGLNLRYGSNRYNFFVEGFYDNAQSEFKTLEGQTIEQKFYVLTLGGDWRFSKNVMLTFGIRQTKDFDNDTYLLQPLINVNCLMR